MKQTSSYYTTDSSSSSEAEDDAQSSMGHPQSLYAVLGVDIMASQEAIRTAYRKLARKWHPDRHQGDEMACQMFQKVQHAYEVLSDSLRREVYDLRLLDQLDVEEYLKRYQGFILTVCGLGMSSRRGSASLPEEAPIALLTAA